MVGCQAWLAAVPTPFLTAQQYSIVWLDIIGYLLSRCSSLLCFILCASRQLMTMGRVIPLNEMDQRIEVSSCCHCQIFPDYQHSILLLLLLTYI